MISTIVVIKGDAITAGSNPAFFAIMGSIEPTILAIITVINNVLLTTNDTSKPTLSKSISFAKLKADKVIPLKTATLDSFHRTLNISLNSNSCNDSPRIIVTDD